ncbi:MAG: type I restriction endonuclease [Clostridium sp.]
MSGGRSNYLEDNLEKASIEILEEMGYEYLYGPDISMDGEYPERKDYMEILLKDRVLDALARNNKGFSDDAISDAYRQIISVHSAMLIENNMNFHSLLKEGIDVPIRKNGVDTHEKMFLIDFENPEKNDFVVCNQFTIVEKEERRPDLIIFVNGVPLVVVELKSASDENVGIEEAYNQIQTYKNDIETLFNFNAFCIISDGVNARCG